MAEMGGCGSGDGRVWWWRWEGVVVEMVGCGGRDGNGGCGCGDGRVW